MHRRDFLGSLVAVAGGLVLPDPERRRVYSFARELRVPGMKRFPPLPAGPGPMRVYVNGVLYASIDGVDVRAGDVVQFAKTPGVLHSWSVSESSELTDRRLVSYFLPL